MDSRGQAYSVFKLLIAAIVAVAVLYILLNIIIRVIPPGNNVQDVAAQMIGKQKDQPGQIDTSTSVTFGAGTSLASKALVGSSGLTKEQICLHKGDYVDNETLQVQGSTIMNAGTQNVTLKARVACDNSNELLETITPIEGELYFDTPETAGPESEGVCACDIVSGSTSTQLCCVVILKYA